MIKDKEKSQKTMKIYKYMLDSSVIIIDDVMYDKVMTTLQDSVNVLSKEYPIEQLNEISDRIIEIQTEVMKVHTTPLSHVCFFQ